MNRHATAIPLMIFLSLTACGAKKKTATPVQGGLSQYVNQARAISFPNNEAEGSLWSDSSARSDLVRDLKAHRVADIVTIAVVESTTAVASATTDTSKESANEAGLPSLFGLEKHIAELGGLLDTNRTSTFQGDGATTRRSTISTSVTCRVIEVFPNGNFLIEGNRESLINGERQIVTVRGIVRPSDVTSNNVVFSTSIAELEIEINGRGVVSGAQKQGLLHKILSGFWPF